MSRRSAVSHEFVEHTSEVQLRVSASSFPDLLREAAQALAGLMLPGGPAAGQGAWRSIVVESTDRAALLVDWLNELVYRAEVERWIPLDIEIEYASDTRLQVRARGVNVLEAPSLVKAATFHGLDVREAPEGLEAEVIFDV